jgi:thymidylate synthase (FAD)
LETKQILVITNCFLDGLNAGIVQSLNKRKMFKKINDPYFQVRIDLNASSPRPSHGIWTAQHQCVADGFAPDNPIPADPAAAIIKHEFKPKHWSVLKFAFVKLDFAGFPHDTVMQMIRHQDSKHSVDDGIDDQDVGVLVQSMRYTGDLYRQCGESNYDVEKLFYVMPEGVYSTRNGTWKMTESDRQLYIADCQRSAAAYSQKIALGHPEDNARRCLAAGYRQNFTMSGTIKSIFHMLDQRTLADSQIECQTLAWMALDELEEWEPGLFQWYRENRAAKNLLSP